MRYRDWEGAAALVAAQETLEVYAFIAAAEESKARGGGVTTAHQSVSVS